MKDLQIFKDSLSFAAKNSIRYFFKWVGYLLVGVTPLVIVGTLFFYKVFSKGYFGPTPYWDIINPLETGLFLVGIIIAAYLMVSFMTVVVQNMFDLCDGKEFRGFANPLASPSVIGALLAQTSGVGLLMYPGLKKMSLTLGGGMQKISAWNSLMETSLKGSYGWLSLLFVVAGLYLGLRLILSYYIAVDTECSMVEAVKKSWKVTGGHHILFISFYLFFAVLNFIPLIFIFTTPFCMLAYVYTCRKLSIAG